jgi:hypothetical protein
MAPVAFQDHQNASFPGLNALYLKHLEGFMFPILTLSLFLETLEFELGLPHACEAVTVPLELCLQPLS